MENPFEKGRSIVFHSKSTAGTKRYLNSSPKIADDDRSMSVYMSENADFENDPGCYWQIIPLDDNKVRLKTLSTSANERILDSSGAADRNISVYLADNFAKAGSHWTPTQHSDGGYSIKSDTPSGTKKVLKANPSAARADSVYLVESDHLVETHFNIGISYHTGGEVQDIINATYPGVAIAIYFEEGTNYGSLDYNGLKKLWDDSKLADYRLKEDKFNDPDFAVCFKADVAKHSYDANLPDDKGILCGVIWVKVKVNNKTHALNFTVDIFGNLILFDPQNGHHVATSSCTPTFCVL